MRVIGITGGIGSGKSTVSAYLRKLGYDVIDADVIARDLADDPEVLGEIRDFFGTDVMTSDGKLDRVRMAEIVFSDVSKRELLESIITSRVIKKAAGIIDDFRCGRLSAAKNATVFLDAPTLFETGAERLVDEVWLVECSVDKRLERALQRDESSIEALRARIAAQMPDDEKAARSDVVINNDGSRDDLYRALDRMLA